LDAVIKKTPDASSLGQIERDNSLMKLREVILDQGENGVSVTLPESISLFPNQRIFWCLLIFGLFLQLSWVLMFIKSDSNS
jgi:hypothetical protein